MLACSSINAGANGGDVLYESLLANEEEVSIKIEKWRIENRTYSDDTVNSNQISGKGQAYLFDSSARGLYSFLISEKALGDELYDTMTDVTEREVDIFIGYSAKLKG